METLYPDMPKKIEAFYQAFHRKDAETMVSYYHDDITFKDPGFGVLKGEQAKNMWRMLCSGNQDPDFRIEASNIQVDGEKGSAHWEAHYLFSRTGRRVHNSIEAHFEFKDGLIYKHVDEFNLHRWATQALGFKGRLLGGTSFFQRKLQQQTQGLLAKYAASR